MREIKAAQVRWDIKNGHYAGAEIDLEAGRGVARCRACTALVKIKAMLRNATRRRGRAALVERGRRLAENRTPEQHEASLLAAQAARRGAQLSDEHRRNLRLAHLSRLRLPGRFGIGIVPGCGPPDEGSGYICYQATLGSRTEAHKICLYAWQRANGQSSYPPRPGWRLSSAEELMDSYEMVVRHKVRGETIDSLAERFNIGSKTVEYRIKRFLKLLPPDDRGSRRLHGITQLLRA